MSYLYRHNKIVERIAASVKKFYTRQEPFRINHGSTNSTRQGLQNRANFVDISDLSEILSVNHETKSALVESNVPMDRLVETTLEHGFVPPVVMEFPGITAGGGYAGTGGESSSFRHGYFNDTVKRVEIILGNGDIVNATPKENADLFYGASGAMGSLGITTLLEIQLIQAKKYVKVTYQHVSSIQEATQTLKDKLKDPSLDYLDGILYSPHHGAIISGQMTDILPPNTPIQSFSATTDPWYYLHVKDATLSPSPSPSTPMTEYIPLAEYLFRYDRGGFWVGESAFKYFSFPFNPTTRSFLDDFCHTRMLYEALSGSCQAGNYIVQDLAMPFSLAAEFIEYTRESFDIWPLWLCPLRPPKRPTLHPHSRSHSPGEKNDREGEEMLLNVGLWGFGPKIYDDFIDKNIELERKLPEFGGMKWLYAQTFYSEHQFWEMFDREWYDGLRRKYKAVSLPDVWKKVALDPQKQRLEVRRSWKRWVLQCWPWGGLWGIWKAIGSRKYLLARNARGMYRGELGRAEEKAG